MWNFRLNEASNETSQTSANRTPSKRVCRIKEYRFVMPAYAPLILQGLTCTFLRGMKSCKVSHILIDGADISLIGLRDLRLRLSIIPQDPTMFEGTVRSNFDQLEEHKDEEIWELSNYSSMEGVLYCKPHFEHLFKESGNFNWNFQSSLTKSVSKLTPELARSPSKAARMFSGTQDKCVTCGKMTYPLEKEMDVAESDLNREEVERIKVLIFASFANLIVA
ncbi:hypothetical protein IFM89_000072 [Coptis chinensis]|uniref:Uncharacterized protein n=1 Tax=Coptis chinensis TaxID=261450 RepID=A0A835M3B5_9MAGN|nr:hypothetical protein IFM89_000072 [Coptis chinensis]